MESSELVARRHRRRRFAIVALGGLGLLVAVVVAATQPPENWARLRELVGEATAWVRGLGAGWFFAAFAVLPAIGFPVSPFAFAAGPLFGPVLGLPGVLALAAASIAVSLTISYVLARHVLRPWVERLLGYVGYRVPSFPAGKEGLFVFIVRMTPGAPYVFQSFLLGLAGVRYRTYLVVSWLVATVNISLMIVFGDALMKGQATVAIAALAGVVVVVTGIRIVRRRLAARAEAALAAEAAAEGRAGDGV
jgi:uncharacterized membrane protein YdjX (TVP38/TMEM64 family)